MNKFKEICFILALASLFACCNSERNQQITAENVIKIDDSELVTHYKASDIFEDLTLIPLETHDSCLIGYISKTEITDDAIYTMDVKSKLIFAFNREGKFRFQISNRGQGPNEYIRLADFTVMKNGDVLILDEYRKLIRFRSDGTHVKSYRLPFGSDAVESLNDTLLVFNGSGRDDNVIVWDICKEVTVNSFFEFDIKHARRIFKPLTRYRESVYFIRPLSLPMIYNVTSEKLENKWFLDFGKRNTYDDKLVASKIEGVEMFAIPPDAVMIDEFTETDDYVIFSFLCDELNGPSAYFVYYSKKTGNKKIVSSELFDDDLTFHKYIPCIMTATSSGQLVYTFTAFMLLENIEKYDKQDDVQVLKNKLKDLNEYDNPVVVLYSLKDF
ncbi:MAG: 6-bladed beta-propeller [Dysgonamonadaceae bacterium]|jgi:hypothetical protein|nr:6-bladed beta-propeller [Dysgonamonadaceae bacterium]